MGKNIRRSRTRLESIGEHARELTSQELDQVCGGFTICFPKTRCPPPPSTETWPDHPDGLMDID